MSGPEPGPLGHLQLVWAELSEQRLSWAFRAYRNFMESLSEDTRSRFVFSDQNKTAYVVLFGKTQVGKTTLLLDLMGVSSDMLPRVSRVLRGGRPHGQSATSTAMEYRRADDCRWRIDFGAGSRELVGDDEMVAALGEIRCKMSEHRLSSENPVTVWIPDECFQTGPGGEQLLVRVLDLPGDSPADQIESEHVQRIAKRYVPHADLILLVGKGDDLSFLRADALQLPGIQDWQFVPERFRIITTYSFTPQSVRSAINSMKHVTLESLRKELLKQIMTHDMTIPDDAESITRYFPMEFGDSWRAELESNSDIARKISPIMARIKNELISDIAASATEHSRLRSAVKVHVVVEKLKKAFIDETSAKIKVQQDICTDITTRLYEIDKMMLLITDDIVRVQDLLNGTPDDARRADIHQTCKIDVAEYLAKVETLGEHVSCFSDLCTQYTSELQRRFLGITLQAAPGTHNFWSGIRPRFVSVLGDLKQVIGDNFDALLAKLGSYSWSTYWPTLSSSFENDKKLMKNAITCAAIGASNIAERHFISLASKRTSELKQEMDKLLCEQLNMRSSKACFVDELQETYDTLSMLDDKCKRFLSRMESDKQKSKLFHRLLDQEYAKELATRRRGILHAATYPKAFLALLGANQLIEERKKVMVGYDR